MNRRVLLVDDNQLVRKSILDVLTVAGFEVVEAKDGLDGLTKAKSGFFDTFVIDYKMPIMDGITLIKGLRDLPEYENHSMTLLTTDDSAEFALKVSSLVDVHVLCKPIDHDVLVSLVSKQSLFRAARSA